MEMQRVLSLIYPSQCTLCRALVDQGAPLCGACWAETPFITGLVCDACGTPLIGEEADTAALCDDCLASPRPWAQGRAALEYRDNARRLVLGLKHGDRQDLAHPCAGWMARAGAELVHRETLIVPVPLHWLRLLGRRFNQAAVLARGVSERLSLAWCPDALVRTRRTHAQAGTVAARAANLDAAIIPNPRRRSALAGRDVLLIDDVMTSGATLTAATEACLRGGAARVSVLVLARVVKDA